MISRTGDRNSEMPGRKVSIAARKAQARANRRRSSGITTGVLAASAIAFMMLTSQTASAAPELELIDTSGSQASMPMTSPSAASPGDTGMDHGAGGASEHGSNPAPMPEMTGMSPDGSGDMPGMSPSEHGSDDMPGMSPSEHGSDDMPGMSPSEHGSDDMPGMSPSEHGSDDMPGMSGHGASEKAAADRPLAPVLGTFGGGAAAVMLAAGFMRRKDRAELEAKTTARAERRAQI